MVVVVACALPACRFSSSRLPGITGMRVARVRAQATSSATGSKLANMPHVRDDGRVVLPVAVAVRRNLVDDIDMESRAAVHHSLGVLGHLAVQLVVGRVVGRCTRRQSCTRRCSARSPRTCAWSMPALRFSSNEMAPCAQFFMHTPHAPAQRFCPPSGLPAQSACPSFPRASRSPCPHS